MGYSLYTSDTQLLHIHSSGMIKLQYCCKYNRILRHSVRPLRTCSSTSTSLVSDSSGWGKRVGTSWKTTNYYNRCHLTGTAIHPVPGRSAALLVSSSTTTVPMDILKTNLSLNKVKTHLIYGNNSVAKKSSIRCNLAIGGYELCVYGCEAIPSQNRTEPACGQSAIGLKFLANRRRELTETICGHKAVGGVHPTSG